MKNRMKNRKIICLLLAGSLAGQTVLAAKFSLFPNNENGTHVLPEFLRPTNIKNKAKALFEDVATRATSAKDAVTEKAQELGNKAQELGSKAQELGSKVGSKACEFYQNHPVFVKTSAAIAALWGTTFAGAFVGKKLFGKKKPEVQVSLLKKILSKVFSKTGLCIGGGLTLVGITALILKWWNNQDEDQDDDEEEGEGEEESSDSSTDDEDESDENDSANEKNHKDYDEINIGFFTSMFDKKEYTGSNYKLEEEEEEEEEGEEENNSSDEEESDESDSDNKKNQQAQDILNMFDEQEIQNADKKAKEYIQNLKQESEEAQKKVEQMMQNQHKKDAQKKVKQKLKTQKVEELKRKEELARKRVLNFFKTKQPKTTANKIDEKLKEKNQTYVELEKIILKHQKEQENKKAKKKVQQELKKLKKESENAFEAARDFLTKQEEEKLELERKTKEKEILEKEKLKRVKKAQEEKKTEEIAKQLEEHEKLLKEINQRNVQHESLNQIPKQKIRLELPPIPKIEKKEKKEQDTNIIKIKLTPANGDQGGIKVKLDDDKLEEEEIEEEEGEKQKSTVAPIFPSVPDIKKLGNFLENDREKKKLKDYNKKEKKQEPFISKKQGEIKKRAGKSPMDNELKNKLKLRKKKIDSEEFMDLTESMLPDQDDFYKNEESEKPKVQTKNDVQPKLDLEQAKKDAQGGKWVGAGLAESQIQEKKNKWASGNCDDDSEEEDEFDNLI